MAYKITSNSYTCRLVNLSTCTKETKEQMNKALVDKETRRRGNKIIVKDKGTIQIRNRKIITFYSLNLP